MMISKDYSLAGLYSLEGFVQRTETSMKARLYSMINTLNTRHATKINKRSNFLWNSLEIRCYGVGNEKHVVFWKAAVTLYKLPVKRHLAAYLMRDTHTSWTGPYTFLPG